MRTLAKYKLNLETIDDKLPNHTLEQVGFSTQFIFENVNINICLVFIYDILGFRCIGNNEKFKCIYFQILLQFK